MTVTAHVTRPAAGLDAAARRRFAVHYLEMVVAMVVGMVALGPVESVVLDALGWSRALDATAVAVMVMATNMTVAMAAWMRWRGHTGGPITEMAGAMYLPFALLLVPLEMGVISESTLMVAGHVLMLAAMALAMLLRLDEYTADHSAHGHH